MLGTMTGFSQEQQPKDASKTKVSTETLDVVLRGHRNGNAREDSRAGSIASLRQNERQELITLSVQ